MINLVKQLIVFVMALTIIVPALTITPQAKADANSLLWDNKQQDIQTNSGLGNQDPRDIAAFFIRVLLGFLGLIALAIVLIGGFKWMTSAGNDEKISEARKMIVAGFIGLLIILAAFGVTNFVISQIYTSTGATG